MPSLSRVSIPLQDHCIRVQNLIELHNTAGLTRQQVGMQLEGTPPTDPQQRILYDERVAGHANEGFDEVRKICRGFFEAGIEGWGFIWSRQIGREWYWHVVAKVDKGFKTPILEYFAAGQIAHRQHKEFTTRSRTEARIQVAHVKSMKDYAHSLPQGPERRALLNQVEEKLNAVEVRNLRLAALNMDAGMSFEDFKQLSDPKDRRLRLFAKQTKYYVEAQEKANKQLLDLVEMYEAFKQILSKDPRELGEGAGKIDRTKP
jgi:hypothetical protein